MIFSSNSLFLSSTFPLLIQSCPTYREKRGGTGLRAWDIKKNILNVNFASWHQQIVNICFSVFLKKTSVQVYGNTGTNRPAGQQSSFIVAECIAPAYRCLHHSSKTIYFPLKGKRFAAFQRQTSLDSINDSVAQDHPNASVISLTGNVAWHNNWKLIQIFFFLLFLLAASAVGTKEKTSQSAPVP